MKRKPPFVGMLVDFALLAPLGFAVGLLGPVDGAPPSFGYISLVQFIFGAATIGLTLAHEFTGGPRGASWSAVVSSVLSFTTLVVAITSGAARTADVSWANAFAANAGLFVPPFLIWMVGMEGSIAWDLLRGKSKDSAASE